LVRRFESYQKEKRYLKGNDLKYNLYMNKIKKLTRMDMGIDVEAYKDYINNLKQFTHLNSDLEFLVIDGLKDNDPDSRTLMRVYDADKTDGSVDTKITKLTYELQVKCDEIQITLSKLRREASSHLTPKDFASA